MDAVKTDITRADIMALDEYGRQRAARRKALVEVKRNRRVSVGPYATFSFENFATMWQQIHEMLFIEKGGEAQIEDELRAYNPLIPKGRDLVATVMFEIDNPVQRHALLGRMGGVENHMSLQFAGHTVAGRPESDVERTNEDGKTSSVHFMHFDFTDEQAAAFRRPGTQVLLGITHPAYGHMAMIPEPVRAALSDDLAP